MIDEHAGSSAAVIEENEPLLPASMRVTEETKVQKSSTATTQVLIIGLLSFCGPGLFNALNGLGNAGSADASVSSIANSCLYCTFAVFGYFGGAMFNLFGPTTLFTLGGCTYAIYAVCIYFTKSYAFLAAVGGVILGMGAGLFWTAQGALVMAYATPQNRGRLIGLFWVIFNFGGVAGGLLEFGLNHNNDSGAASPISYFLFIAVMLAGAVAAPCLLAHPSNVVKEDGSAVVLAAPLSARDEIRAALQAINDPFIKCNLLFYFCSNWFYTYDFNGFNGAQFNVRTRGLNSAFFWGSQMLTAWLFGMVLDAKSQPKARAKHGLVLIIIGLVASFGLAIWINHFGLCDGGTHTGWDKSRHCSLDYQSLGTVFPMAVYMLLGAVDAMYQNFAYWLMSMAAGNDLRRTVMYSAVYKGVQSLGAGLAWVSDLNHGFSYQAQGIVALSLTLLACVPVIPSLRSLELEHEPDQKPTNEHESTLYKTAFGAIVLVTGGAARLYL